MSTRPLATLGALMAVVAGGCTSAPSPSPAPLTLGLLVSDAAAGGIDAVRGAELAVELVNQSYPQVRLPLATEPGLPGVRGATLRLAIAETGGDPDAAEAAAGELIGEPVAGIVAADSADVVANAAALATRRGVPLVDATTTAGHLLDLGLDWYFRTGPTDQTVAEAAFALLAADPPPGQRRGVVVTVASEPRADVVPLLPDLARTAGLTMAGPIQVNGDGDFDFAARLAEADADLVFAVAGTRSGSRLLRQVLGGSDVSSAAVVALGPGHLADADAGVSGWVRPVIWSAEFAGRHPLAEAIAEEYEARYGQPMTGQAAAAFTAVMVLAQAVDTAGGADPATARVALRQLSLPATRLVMPWFGVGFAANGQNELATAVVEQRDGDRWRVVFPPELAAASVSWPTPPAEEGTL